MKWIVALVLSLLMITPAMAGQDPYISIVGIDCVPGDTFPFFETYCPDVTDLEVTAGSAEPFYFSPKYRQFMYYEPDFGINTRPWEGDPTKFPGGLFCLKAPASLTQPTACERFRSQHPAIQPEICDLSDTLDRNSRVTAGNAGWFEWFVRLPKKPTGEINLVLQCGVLKPNARAIYGEFAVELCAAETGELIGPNCSHNFVDPGTQPIKIAGLPQIKAIAYPGLYNEFAPFNLTAYKNPSNYTLSFDGSGNLLNSAASQTLDGSTNARILLKSCMDKTIVVKLPVAGQVNAMNQPEADLVEGDLIYVRMDIPRGNTVDVYCHAQSLRVMGIGESPF